MNVEMSSGLEETQVTLLSSQLQIIHVKKDSITKKKNNNEEKPLIKKGTANCHLSR